jgi:hypothetical protein
MNQSTIDFVRVPSTREDRAELVALRHRAKRAGKTQAQTRSNDRRKAIDESREEAGFPA